MFWTLNAPSIADHTIRQQGAVVEGSPPVFLRQVLLDPFLNALMLCVVLASVLPVSGETAVWFGWLVDAAIALLFFLHGAKLSRETVIAGMIHWRLHLTVLAATFVVFPLIGLGLRVLTPSFLNFDMYVGILFLCILPSTIQSSIAFTSIAGGNVPAAVCAATLSNLLGIFITPLAAGVLLSGKSGGISFGTLQTILLQLLLPFILGQIVQPYVGSLIARHRKLIGLVDRGSILLVVYGTFSAAVTSGLWRNTSLYDFTAMTVTCCILLAIMLAITILGSRALGFSREDESAIVFCGSKKSLASGVPIASVIFAGQNIGAILLPVMVFHQIQLMVCVVLARMFSRCETS